MIKKSPFEVMRGLIREQTKSRQYEFLVTKTPQKGMAITSSYNNNVHLSVNLAGFNEQVKNKKNHAFQ